MSLVARNIFKGVASGGLGVFAALLIQLVTVPFFIKSWGVELYADWLVIAALPMLLSISDLGVINVLANRAAFAFSRGRYKLVARYLATGFVSLLPLASSILIVLFIFIKLAVKDSLIESFNAVVLLLLGHAFFSLQCTFLAAAFRSIRRFHVGSYCINSTRLAEFVVICSVLLCGGSAVELAFGLLLVRVVTFFIMWRILKAKVDVDVTLASKVLFTLTLRDSLTYFLIPASQLGFSQSLIFIVGSKFDGAMVVFFNSARVLCRLMLLGANMLAGAWRQELTRYYALVDRMSFYTLFKRLLILNASAVFCAFVLLYLFGEWFFDLWLGPAGAFSFSPFLLVLISVAVAALVVPMQMILMACNRHVRYAYEYSVVSILSLGCMYVSKSFSEFLLWVLVAELLFLAIAILGNRRMFKACW